MKKFLFLILLTFNSFAFKCELKNSAFVQNKSIDKSISLIFEDISLDSGNSVSELTLDSGNKLQFNYIAIDDTISGFTRFVGNLELLRHKGGNGYEVLSTLKGHTFSSSNGVLRFDLSLIFGDRSESVDYQSSERIDLQNYILECSIL